VVVDTGTSTHLVVVEV
jgi:hypothetical protein